jgi:IgGFc binding protein
MNASQLKTKLFLIFFFTFNFCKAQNIANSSTDFWFGCMNLQGGYRLHISSDVNTSGTLSMPLTGLNIPFTVNANSTTEVPLSSAQVVFNTSDTVGNMGIHVTTLDPVTVQLLSTNNYFAEATHLYPMDRLGLEYTIASYNNGGGFPGSKFLIAATDNNTQVQVTLTDVSVGGVPPWTLVSTTMNAGEVLQYNTTNNDITASRVTASKPIAVFSGHSCADVPVNSSFCNPLLEQMIPEDRWGNYFITTPFQTRQNGDRFRIIPRQNNTEIFINGTLVSTINQGSPYETTLLSASEITSNYPVSVFQYSHSASIDNNSNSDPFMVTLTPINQGTRKSLFTTNPVGNVSTNFYSNIVTLMSNAGLVTLDGNPLGAAQFNQISGTPYGYAAITLGLGFHTIQSDSDFAAIVYGYGFRDGFGYSINNVPPSSVTALHEVAADPIKLIATPSVFSEYTTIQISKPIPDNCILQLFNLQGQVILQSTINNNSSLRINGDNLSSGTYFIRAISNGSLIAGTRICYVK